MLVILTRLGVSFTILLIYTNQFRSDLQGCRDLGWGLWLHFGNNNNWKHWACLIHATWQGSLVVEDKVLSPLLSDLYYNTAVQFLHFCFVRFIKCVCEMICVNWSCWCVDLLLRSHSSTVLSYIPYAILIQCHGYSTIFILHGYMNFIAAFQPSL